MDASPEMTRYFEEIEREIARCHDIASRCKRCGRDPDKVVEIKFAKNMAERVVGLISSVSPQIADANVDKRIIELEREYSPMDWRVALIIAEEVAREKFCKFKDRKEAIEIGIRTGFAYHTCGIVAAPLEGFISLEIKKTRDGKEYFSPFYAGPIRGAGGTAAAFSVILTDYVRVKLGYAKFDPDEKEISRFKTEIADYHEKVTNLQYFPSPEEVEFLAKHIPVEINGDPTEKFDVSNFKDLPRIDTNKIRGGLCLVLAEGVSQKAPKLWKRLSVWGKEFGLEWGFLAEFLELQKKIKAHSATAVKKEKISPNYTYIKDLVAGRPILTHPMRDRGFRLRLGRTRLSGFSAAAINPATQIILKKYIATGTQLKVERPGKACSITPCDLILGPTVLLKDGSVLRIRTMDEAKAVQNDVKRIIFLGDLMFSYGDFSENGHVLVPIGFNEEWYARELERAGGKMPGTLDEALQTSKDLGVPLLPEFTYFWRLISIDDLKYLKEKKAGEPKLDMDARLKEILEKLCIPHTVVRNESIEFSSDHAKALALSLGNGAVDEAKTVLENINALSGVRVMDTCGTFIGARMGRPEKAKMRAMTGSPHVLFPVGDEGGRLRSFQEAISKGKVTADFATFRCPNCNNTPIYPICEKCGTAPQKIFFCRGCNKEIETEVCKLHGDAISYRTTALDIKSAFEDAQKLLGQQSCPDLVKGVRGTSNKEHIPEHLLKGILRSKHDICVNKDGTTRFDMTELPITHFKPKEIGTPIEKLLKIGYTKDIKGEPLQSQEQIVELKPQDVILPAGKETSEEQADKVLVRVARFIDEMLSKLYGLEGYYNVKGPLDLIGHLGIGLAPHTSAGMICRIIGFSQTQGMLCHPLMHAAMRRDCDGDESCIMLLLDGLINFSRKYLPESRGARTMDAPLVLSSKIIPSEVDDQVLGLDIAWKYPLELYQASLEYKNPWDIKIEQIRQFLNTERQYEKMGFTHDIEDFNKGVNYSAYKVLPSMEEKLDGQMELARMIDAVDESDVAKWVIEKHFMKDTKGNLRKFSTQQVRCINCNEKYRRIPLMGKCHKCGGRIIFTVSQGSVIKYFNSMLKLSRDFNVGSYLVQALLLLEQRINSVFGKEKEKQEGLVKWF